MVPRAGETELAAPNSSMKMEIREPLLPLPVLAARIGPNFSCHGVESKLKACKM